MTLMVSGDSRKKSHLTGGRLDGRGRSQSKHRSDHDAAQVLRRHREAGSGSGRRGKKVKKIDQILGQISIHKD